MFKTNREVELMGSGKNSWLLMYAEGSTFYIPNALHVERNDELMLVEDDNQASRAAEKAGVPLINDMWGIPMGVYVDTEENRRIISEMLIKYPEYKITTYSLINVDKEVDGLVDGVWMQDSTGTLNKAIEKAKATEKANGNRIKVAVVEGLGYGCPNYCLRRELKRLG